MVRITILGSTGSIGRSTLNVLALHSDQFEVFALTGHKQIDLLLQQAIRFKPRYVVVTENTAATSLQNQLKAAGLNTEVLIGQQGMCAVATAHEVDCVMAALVGAVGLVPTLAAVNAGKRVLLANKEALIMAGAVFMSAAHQSKGALVPVDSEHNAILQCLPLNYKVGQECPDINKITLTASGGAFRNLPIDQLPFVTPEQAKQHPNWAMGAKITVDCATMMNKGFEVIEAYWLFNLKLEQLQVLMHPQSIVHALVEFKDGSTLAQLGQPDMCIPISYALNWPKRTESGVAGLDWSKLARLDFLPLDTVHRYPCAQLAFDALRIGSSATCILNAANEVAVEAFLQGQIRFTDIYRINSEVLATENIIPANDLESLLAIDASSRARAREIITELATKSSLHG